MIKDIMNNDLVDGSQLGESFKDIESELANVKCGRKMLLQLFEFCVENMPENDKQDDYGLGSKEGGSI